MAKRAARRESGNDDGGSADSVPRTLSPRDAAIDALVALLAERGFHEITLADIADRAGMSLPGLRAAFPGKLSILAAFSERIDLAVLAGAQTETGEERDRLFDVLMRRFDALTPYRMALRSLSRSASRDPALAGALALVSDRSMKWMLAAARVGHGGVLGRIETSGAAMVYAQALRTWLREDDTANEKTMAAVDRGLRRGERAMGYIRDACTFLGAISHRRRGGLSDSETMA